MTMMKHPTSSSLLLLILSSTSLINNSSSFTPLPASTRNRFVFHHNHIIQNNNGDRVVLSKSCIGKGGSDVSFMRGNQMMQKLWCKKSGNCGDVGNKESAIVAMFNRDRGDGFSNEEQLLDRQSQHVSPINLLRKKVTKLSKVVMLAFLIFIAPVITSTGGDVALATETGGRMGGSFSRGSSSSYSRSYSAPSRSSSSYGGRSSSSFNSPRFYGSYSRPTTIIAPIGVPSYGYAAPAYYNPFSGIVNFFFTGFFLFVMVNIATQFLSDVSSSDSTAPGVSALGKGVTVASFSVALNVPNRDDPRSFLSCVTRLSETAQTDSRIGLQTLELLRQRRSIFAANSKSEHFNNADKAIRDYNQIAINQRSKFERETISKYKGVDYSSPSNTSAIKSNNDYKATVAVVTLVFAIEGDSTKLPSIRGIRDVEEALSKIAADVKVEDCLMSAEILWTPGDASETLTERDIYVDYPELRSI